MQEWEGVKEGSGTSEGGDKGKGKLDAHSGFVAVNDRTEGKDKRMGGSGGNDEDCSNDHVTRHLTLQTCRACQMSTLDNHTRMPPTKAAGLTRRTTP